jgi:hypothetical protein
VRQREYVTTTTQEGRGQVDAGPIGSNEQRMRLAQQRRMIQRKAAREETGPAQDASHDRAEPVDEKAAEGAGEKPQEPLRMADDPDVKEVLPVLEAERAQKEAGADSGGEQAGADPENADIMNPRKQDGGKDDATAPDEMTGIGSDLAVGRFVDAAKHVQADWTTFKPEDRAHAFCRAANDELTRVQVRRVGAELEDLGTTSGEFRVKDWTLALGKRPFSKPSVDDDQAAQMANTVFHETRHAEQMFRIARLMAGRGKKPQEISNQTKILREACDDAAKNPLDTTSKEGAEAQVFCESRYGKGRAHTQKVMNDLDANTKARAQAESEYGPLSVDPNADPQKVDAAFKKWADAVKKWDESYQAYRELPEEKDAFAVGYKVKDKYLDVPKKP